MPEARIYAPAERPDVEVRVDGAWYQGELRAWFPNDDGTWRAQVQWRRQAGSTGIDTFVAEDVRLDESEARG
jgi:hypothetical protein